MKSLPGTATSDHQWESNPKPFDDSNFLPNIHGEIQNVNIYLCTYQPEVIPRVDRLLLFATVLHRVCLCACGLYSCEVCSETIATPVGFPCCAGLLTDAGVVNKAMLHITGSQLILDSEQILCLSFALFNDTWSQ